MKLTRRRLFIDASHLRPLPEMAAQGGSSSWTDTPQPRRSLARSVHRRLKPSARVSSVLFASHGPLRQVQPALAPGVRAADQRVRLCIPAPMFAFADLASELCGLSRVPRKCVAGLRLFSLLVLLGPVPQRDRSAGLAHRDLSIVWRQVRAAQVSTCTGALERRRGVGICRGVDLRVPRQATDARAHRAHRARELSTAPAAAGAMAEFHR